MNEIAAAEYLELPDDWREFPRIISGVLRLKLAAAPPERFIYTQTAVQEIRKAMGY